MSNDGLRIWRSPYSNFYKDELLNAPEAYPLSVLREIAAAGFTAIWIRGILRDIVRTRVFPELGTDGAAVLRALRTVVRRAHKAGLKVCLYMQPPMGRPESHRFWRQHPEVKGATYRRFFGKNLTAMCVSTPQVQAFLREAAMKLSNACPDLGAVITITASEYVSHCYSHYHNEGSWGKKPGEPVGCDRCDQRRPRDVVGDINRSLYKGLQDAGHGMRLVAWNWSWSFYDPDPQQGIIDLLPSGITVMAGFERGGTKTILGKKRVIDEYSLAYPGPSPRFTKTLRACTRRGIPVMAKLQIGTTHELATVPNLPLIGSLYDKARAMRRLGVTDFLGCWNFGNMLTANTAALVHFLDADPLPPRRLAMEQFAADYLPGCEPKTVVRAWLQFAKAMDHYPFCIPFMYFGPVNHAVQLPIQAGPLSDVPCGRSWMRDRRGDVLPDAFKEYTYAEVVKGLGEVARQWAVGADLLAKGLADSQSDHAREELNTARVAGHCFHSCWNLYRAYPLRKAWKASHKKTLRPILEDEREHLTRLLPIVVADKRQGYHSECQHRMFTPSGIRRKLKQLDHELAE